MPVRQQHIRPADRIAVDRQASREARIDWQWKPRRRDVTARGAIDGLPLVGAADDVADVAAVDQELVSLLDRAAISPRHKARRAQHDRGEQAVVRVGDPTGLAVDVPRVDKPVRLVQINHIGDIHQTGRPPGDPRARLVAANDGVDTAEPPRVNRHEQRCRRHLHRLAEGKPSRELGQKRLDPNLAKQIGIAARGIDGRRVALDLIAAPAQAEDLLDHESLASTGVGETAVKDGDPPSACVANVPPAADQEEAQDAPQQGVAGCNGVIEDDRAGGDTRRKAKPASQDQRARHLEVAKVARARGNRKAEQQCRVGGHRLERRDGDADGGEKEREVEGIDQQGEHRQSGQARAQRWRPESARAGAKGKRLTRDRRGEPRGKHAARQP